MVSVILAAVRQLERTAIRSIVEKDVINCEVKEADDIEEVLSILESGVCPDLAVLDTELDSEEDIFLLERLTTNFSFLKVLIISTNSSEEIVKTAFSLGVKGYLLKDCCMDELSLAITQIAAGKEMLCSSLGLKF
jgi:two-component system response regulator YesN